MSVLGDVLSSLRTMSQWQLLLAFLACMGYAFGQGSLLLPKGRRIAWIVALVATLGFGVESTEWMNAAMLVAFAIAGLGLFVASAWLISRAIGFGTTRPAIEIEGVDTAGTPLSAAPPARARPHRSGPAHSV